MFLHIVDYFNYIVDFVNYMGVGGKGLRATVAIHRPRGAPGACGVLNTNKSYSEAYNVRILVLPRAMDPAAATFQPLHDGASSMTVMDDCPVAAHYYKELLNFCARNLRNGTTAADLVQEAYARFLSAQRSGTVIADPRALLYRTTRNLLTDQYRRGAVRAYVSLDALADESHPSAPRYLQPEEVYAFSQYAQAIYTAIESLPPRCREAFILNRFDGLSHQEVADRMGISRNMVAQHVIRGVLVCKACDDRFHGRAAPAE